MLVARDAEPGDIDAVVALTRAQRSRLAHWSPVYFNPRDGADEAHAGYLAYVVASPDHETVVLDDAGHVCGFFVAVPQDQHLWIDDLCLADEARWPDAIRVVAETSTAPWVTCVAGADHARRRALDEAGMRLISTYHVRPTAGITPGPEVEPSTVDPKPGGTPQHTFGGRALSADQPGALVVTDEQGSYVIGSPGMTPPTYDPGGPTCVIDQIVGNGRSVLLANAVGVAAGRGDAQVVVVCPHDDPELAQLLEATGFTAEVCLIGT